MAKRIPLTGGRSAIVDDADYGRLSKYEWYAAKVIRGPQGGFYWYAARKSPKPGGGQRMVYMQDALAGAGGEVDHVNGNTLDNRRENLKKGTHASNMQNLHKRKGRV